MSEQKYSPDVKHSSNCLYHEQDKSRKEGSKHKTQAINYGREDKKSENWLEWVLHILGIGG